MPIGISKRTNEYATLIERTIDAPKAVWMALAVSLANQLAGGPLDRGLPPVDTLMAEWQALHNNGIVPQRPTRRRATMDATAAVRVTPPTTTTTEDP